ncbi:hypothetical protein A5647_21265 [Mycobacterium sp. 1100029.7]|nr:hypothetical protein A5647_21265 [Mycobacterium sp. 1100029.7]
MRCRLTLSLACLVLVVAGCSSPDVEAHDSDNGGHVAIDKGDVFDIVLADDYATTNCQWHPGEPNDWAVLKLLGYRYEPDRTAPGASSGGTFTSRYKGTGTGTVHVTLVEEDNANPPHIARRYALDATVR